MMFDSKNIVYGNIHIINTMGTVIGPEMFFLGFEGAGITITGGHETMIFTSWFGQYLYSNHLRANATATGIQIFGNDHYLWNTIVFGGKIGVHVTNPATIVSGTFSFYFCIFVHL